MSAQPGIVYEWDGGLREVVRQHHGGLSPGDVIERESTQSDPDAGLPELDVPGRGDLGDHCGDDFPAFACGDCAKVTYVGRTCRSPTCSRCWAASVKDNAIRAAAKIENHRYDLFYDRRDDEDVRTQHVVASAPPSVMFDSEEPMERALLSIQTLLPQFMKEPDNRSFYAVYHPFRIKKEYRKPVYDHPGEQGEGDMRWKDVLSSDDWQKYVSFEPHFHVFCNTRYFEKTISEKVEDESGWVFHRIEDADNKSVENIEDLAQQLTYCLSHAGVRPGERDEMVTRYKGDLHNTPTHPKGIERATAAFCENSYRLLGVQFANTLDQACDADVPADQGDADHEHDHAGDDAHAHSDPRETDFSKRTIGSTSPLVDEVTYESKEKVARSGGGSPIRDGRTPGSASGESGSEWGESRNSGFSADSSGWTARGAADLEASSDDQGDQDDVAGDGQLTLGDDRGDDADAESSDQVATCGGDLVPMTEAVELLDDPDWCRQAPYVAGLRRAAREWEHWKGRWQGRDADVAPAPPWTEAAHMD